MPPSLKQQVIKRTQQVRGELDKSIATLEREVNPFFDPFGFMSGSEAKQAYLRALKGMRPLLEQWADRGLQAVAQDKIPSKGGWPGWFDAADAILKGVADLSLEGSRARIAVLRETIQEIDFEKDLKKGAAILGRTANNVATAAAGGAFSFLGPLSPILIPASLIVLGVFIVKDGASRALAKGLSGE